MNFLVNNFTIPSEADSGDDFIYFFVTGGSGFIGSNLVRSLVANNKNRVTVFDNFSSGQISFLSDLFEYKNLNIIEGDCSKISDLLDCMSPLDTVFHLASNSDIASAAINPDVDFANGTALTRAVLEAMRIKGSKRIFFTSGSGVYGEIGLEPVAEDYPLMQPISTYGAQKLASESLICAYSFMFDIKATIFRFANVVGDHQTHGVGFDFFNKLMRDNKNLEILGDGSQSKPYIHVSDVINAFLILLNNQRTRYEYFNVSNRDFLTVNQVASITQETLGLNGVSHQYTGGSRGWKADVPLYRLNFNKIMTKYGWEPNMSSTEAVKASIKSMLNKFMVAKAQK